MRKNRKNYKDNNRFIDTAILNNETFMLYMEQFKKIALSLFEWVNLPSSMNAEFLEQCLFYYGMASILNTDKYGFINTKCSINGDINIYGLPTKLNCYSYGFQTSRNVYMGFTLNEDPYSQCILVKNNIEMIPTSEGLELFALRLYEAERVCDVNIKAQKTPILILADDTSRLMMKNLYNEYDGNMPFIFGDKRQLSGDVIRSIKTDAPFVADKIMEYKKQILNEALTYLGINNVMLEKKERLISDEANSNNEFINLNLQSYLLTRQKACKEFNEKYGYTGTNKEISVRVRSDLHNVIKNANSIITDYNDKKNVVPIESGVN